MSEQEREAFEAHAKSEGANIARRGIAEYCAEQHGADAEYHSWDCALLVGARKEGA